jgi:hypothetical protein
VISGSSVANKCDECAVSRVNTSIRPTFHVSVNTSDFQSIQNATVIDANVRAPHRSTTQGPICVDVEFGHHVLYSMHSNARIEEVRISTEIARVLIAALNSHGVRIRTSLLVDDKPCRCTCGLNSDLAEFCEYAAGIPVDRVMMESDLAELWEALIGEVRPDRRDYLRRQAEKWSAAHDGSLACSQDIAIWHSLRLGLIGSSAAKWRTGSCTDFGEAESGAVFCVSILPRRFRTFENRAREEILSCIPHFPPDALNNVYFESKDQSRKWESTVRRIVSRIRRAADERGLLYEPSQDGLSTSAFRDQVAAVSELSQPSVLVSFIDSPVALQTASTEAAV